LDNKLLTLIITPEGSFSLAWPLVS